MSPSPRDRHRGPAERREVDPGEPAVRQASGDRPRQPGVTRDRLELEATGGAAASVCRHRRVLQRAGGHRGAGGRSRRIAPSTEADLIVLVVDVHDRDHAGGRRRSPGGSARRPTPVLVVANKAERPRATSRTWPSLHRLGLGEPFPGLGPARARGRATCWTACSSCCPKLRASTDPILEPRFAIVGRPNVGKSSLFNRLVGARAQRRLGGRRHDEGQRRLARRRGPGPVRCGSWTPPGMRRGTKVRGVEYYSVVARPRGDREQAHVAVLVLDAPDGLPGRGQEDREPRDGRGPRVLLLVANKWDLVEDKDRPFKNVSRTRCSSTRRRRSCGRPRVRGQGVHRLPPLLLDLHSRWMSRAPTSTVNEIIQAAQAERPTPQRTGNLHYATQVSTAPPTFVIFGGATPAERDLSALPREPPSSGAAPRRGSDPSALPCSTAPPDVR